MTSVGVRWDVAYPLNYRHVEDLMEEGGISVDRATINHWVLKYSPLLEEAFHRHKRPVWASWRMDETYMKVAQIEPYSMTLIKRHTPAGCQIALPSSLI